MNYVSVHTEPVTFVNASFSFCFSPPSRLKQYSSPLKKPPVCLGVVFYLTSGIMNTTQGFYWHSAAAGNM